MAASPRALSLIEEDRAVFCKHGPASEMTAGFRLISPVQSAGRISEASSALPALPPDHAVSVLPKRVGKSPAIVARIASDKLSDARGVLQALTRRGPLEGETDLG
jgi:hypothetical protein